MRRTPLHIARVSDNPMTIEVIASNEIARGYLDIAIELWRLSGHEERASAIEELVTSAHASDPPRISPVHITRLRELLRGIEEALVGSVTGEHHILSHEQLEELRGRVEAIEIDESWGADATNVVQEALVYVDHLRDIADEALAQNASILFD